MCENARLADEQTKIRSASFGVTLDGPIRGLRQVLGDAQLVTRKPREVCRCMGIRSRLYQADNIFVA